MNPFRFITQQLTQPKKRLITNPLIGQKFGRLTVTDHQPIMEADGQQRLQCMCDCGNTHWVRRGNLTSGHIKSCGCQRRERAVALLPQANAARKAKRNPRPDLFTSQHCPCSACGKTTLNTVSKLCDLCIPGVPA